MIMNNDHKQAEAQQNAVNKEKFLESPSGFRMPFDGDQGNDVEISLDYGQQIHPMTGVEFHHSGIDLVCPERPLYAMATGTVVGMGNDPVHDNYLTIRYGKYEVKYGHISEAYVGYGTPVVAGQQVGKSGSFLHIGVLFEKEEINPVDLLSIIYMNVLQLESMGIKGSPQLADFGINVKTGYEKDEQSIVDMMLRYLPEYFSSITEGTYLPTSRFENQLRNVCGQAADRNYYFENVPTYGNPLGLSPRSAPLVGKLHSLLIGDFLAFMASRHQMYVPSWDEAQKKNLLNRFHPDLLPSIP